MAFQKKPISAEKALQRLAEQCSRGEHSSGEMMQKLRQWGLAEHERQDIIDRLIDEKYIDDERFCRAFVNDKVHFDRWGRRKIELALYKKGVSKDISTPILDLIDEQEYISTLRELLITKRRTTHAESEYEMNGKLIRYALARGFTYDVIRKCIDSADDYDITIDEDELSR